MGNHPDESLRETTGTIREVYEKDDGTERSCGGETDLQVSNVRVRRCCFCFCCFLGIEQRRSKKICFPIARRSGRVLNLARYTHQLTSINTRKKHYSYVVTVNTNRNRVETTEKLNNRSFVHAFSKNNKTDDLFRNLIAPRHQSHRSERKCQ